MSVVENKFLVKEGTLGKLYIYWDEYSSKLFLHIRYWYVDKADGIEKPGRKGIAIPAHILATVLQALKWALENRPEGFDAEPEGSRDGV
ncbi:MAG: transcriptional coactivator p15/PC4 family protein [Candidatus Obscuribacterales bacterium]|nr:transcriptional coactivator p15/PC4 family protein [Candidatus Obscuribacterales bacterium]